MDLRFWISLFAGKIVRFTIKATGGGATAAPGLVSEYIDHLSLKKMGRFFERPLMVTGTNGKTTTSRIIGTILTEAKIDFIHNRAGSNLLRGIIGLLNENFPFFSTHRKLPLIEIDEPTLYSAINGLDPEVIVFNNLFRDQLDRYGEIEIIRKIWQKSLLLLNEKNIIALNGDDPSISHLSTGTKAKLIYFGIDDKKISLGKLPHASDFINCTYCGGELRFSEIYLSHLGNYKCSVCGQKRPKLDVVAKNIRFDFEKGFSALITTPKGKFEAQVPIPGVFSVYNTLAAVSCALALNIELKIIQKALSKIKPAFGRTEQVTIDDKNLFINLVKNPAGFNEFIKVLNSISNDKYLFIAINDLTADGRDVSWLWDVDFEELFSGNKIKKLWISGTRASDMNLRVKYTNKNIRPIMTKDIESGLSEAINNIQVGSTLFVIPTYTAMLSVKAYLAKKGFSDSFWED